MDSIDHAIEKLRAVGIIIKDYHPEGKPDFPGVLIVLNSMTFFLLETVAKKLNESDTYFQEFVDMIKKQKSNK